MTVINEGKQGAKRHNMKHDPLLKVVRTVIDSIPAKDRDNMRDAKYARRFHAAIEEHPDSIELTDAIFDYMWVRLVNRATQDEPTQADKAAARAATSARLERNKAAVRMGVEAEAKRMFLDMTMPNGKSLRGCSFKEVRTMAPHLNKVFGFLVRSPAKDRELVGNVYKNNDELLAASKVK